ncbi:protein PLASTID REDOX INSENSITIVE 2, chloroplastic-like [Argentina anserina]|uniref:protein PLASTID REDOX INSENSITIVE 2, chloroplastic-like n=1 Tax=Argentina anserina TaxID=57926 RepID=UPI00217627E0|nr:protein PLASTID REDOX INSENSITIVE 2, chloroplastic-like [Potentilla anserina]
MALHRSSGPLISSPLLTPATTQTSTIFIRSRTPPVCVNATVKATTALPLKATAGAPQKHVYPDPIPEFAEFETHKFRAELSRKLFKDKANFGDEFNSVVDVCAEIFSEFLLKEYGGPGTLLVDPFTDMLVALKERDLPGAPLAARASLLWAQNYLDQDWDVWNSKSSQ